MHTLHLGLCHFLNAGGVLTLMDHPDWFDWKGANKFAWYFSYPIQITPCNLMVILHLGKKLNALLFSFVFTFLCGPSRSVGHMFDRTIHVFEYQVQGS